LEIHSNNPTTQSVALLVAALSSFLTPFMASAMNVALRAVGSEFSMSAVLLGWVGTSYLLAAAVFLVPIGKAADIAGRKRIFLWGVLIYTLASLLCAVAPTTALFIAFRVLQGIGSAFIYGTGVAILTSVFPPGERGRVLGIVTAATYLGLSLGPVSGGFLTGLWGWRSIFWVNVPLGLVILPLAFWKLEGEWAEAAGERFDWAGSAAYGAALAAAMLGFPRLPAPVGIGLTLAGVVGLLLFIGWEARAATPILNVGLFRNNAAFTFSNLAALINYSATSASGFLLSLYLQHIKGLSPQAAGLVLVAQPVVMAALSPLAGRLSDWIESRTLASAGMALTTLALLPFIFLNAQTPFWAIILYLAILGCGFGLFSSPNVNAIMSAVERKSYGVASATLGTMRLIGQTLSMGIATLIFALYLGQVAITPEVYPQFMASLKPAFAVFAVLCFVGVFASLARGNTQHVTHDTAPGLALDEEKIEAQEESRF
jgi:EmrB/QacA subfamily drug resistance transporter